jgi:hypothetical protein
VAVDFGTDIACVNDIDGVMSLTNGLRNLGSAIARRLITPRGGLAYAPDYGFDVRGLLNSGQTDDFVTAAQQAIELECEKDERVEAAAVLLEFNEQASTLLITIQLTTADGPFTLVLSVSAVTVAILGVR